MVILTLDDALYGEEDYNKIITFISDRSKGLVNAVAKVFPSAPNTYCLRHLQANFLKANGRLGKALKAECWRVMVKVTYARTSTEFEKAINEHNSRRCRHTIGYFINHMYAISPITHSKAGNKVRCTRMSQSNSTLGLKRHATPWCVTWWARLGGSLA